MSKVQIKKQKTKQKEIKIDKTTNPTQIDMLVKVVLAIVLVLVAFYVLTLFIKKEEDIPNDSEGDVTISYSTILFSNLLSKEGSYYALAISDDDLNKDLYNAYLSVYSSKEKSFNYYMIDLDDTFNKGYISDKSNLNTDKINELKISRTTLFKIKNKKIEAYYDNKDAIVEHLKTITE